MTARSIPTTHGEAGEPMPITWKENDMSYSKGGFEDRFRVTRVDGKPIDPTARYLVLDYSGRDPHADYAIMYYAGSVEKDNPQFAADLRAALITPENWPAQHD